MKKLLILLTVVFLFGCGTSEDESVASSEDKTPTFSFTEVGDLPNPKNVKNAAGLFFGDRYGIEIENEGYTITEFSVTGDTNAEKLSKRTIRFMVEEDQEPVETVIEMVDFLHYLQLNGLTNPENTLGNEKYVLEMYAYPNIKPGMNTPEPLHTWKLESDKIGEMDFTDKKSMVYEVHRYGEYSGVGPVINE